MTSLKPNDFKAALAKGQLQRGVWCTIPNALTIEMLAGAGFDWMLIDTEHSPMDPVTVLPLLQAAAAYPVTPIVRPGSLNVAEIKKLLDIGAQSLLIPYIETAEDAELAAASVEYPPKGIRGVAGSTRASGFGRIKDYAAKARDEICLIVQVETQKALDNLEAIAGTPGIDAIFVGPADLAASLGYPGQPGHPVVVAAVMDAISRIGAAGLPAGILTMSDEVYDAAIETGALFVARDLDLVAMRKGLSIG